MDISELKLRFPDLGKKFFPNVPTSESWVEKNGVIYLGNGYRYNNYLIKDERMFMTKDAIKLINNSKSDFIDKDKRICILKGQIVANAFGCYNEDHIHEFDVLKMAKSLGLEIPPSPALLRNILERFSIADLRYMGFKNNLVIMHEPVIFIDDHGNWKPNIPTYTFPERIITAWGERPKSIKHCDRLGINLSLNLHQNKEKIDIILQESFCRNDGYVFVIS